MTRSVAAPAPSVADTLKAYLRGGVGGLIFSLPILYTMEVWWHGFTIPPLRLGLYLAFTFALLLLYNRYVGLRPGAAPGDVVVDSVQELGVGVAVSAGALWALGRIGADTAWDEALGKILIEGMSVAIGVSIGTAQLGVNDDEEGEQADDEVPPRHGGLLHEMALGLCGAVIVAANIAPTEEVLLLAAETDPWRQLVLAFASMLIAVGTLFAIDFVGSGYHDDATAGDVVVGALATYAVALVASGCLLWFFGQFDGVAPIVGVGQVIVLGLPAALGASAGRLLLSQ